MNAHRHRPTGRTLLQRAGATAAGLLPIGRALAQGAPFPSHPITLICPWPPSGSTDRHLRALAELANKQLGQNAIILNKPGGGTNGPGVMALTATPDDRC